MFLGYNTNGLAHHDLLDAVGLLAEIGYRAVGITIDHGALSPREEFAGQIGPLRRLLQRHAMRSVIETGARFLLNPHQKHEPTLLSADPASRARRVEFYRHAIGCAVELESDCVSLWSGVLREPVARDAAMARLTVSLGEVLDYAAAQGVAIGLEPEPGMLIDSTAAFEELAARPGMDALRITLDVGHLECQGEVPHGHFIRRAGPRLVNVHLEDMRPGAHEHLMFGEGRIDFPPVFAALAAARYRGGVYVELSRHSHEGPAADRRAYEFLTPILERTLSHHA